MEIRDLRNLKWTTTRAGGTSYGCYYKATNIESNKKFYYKCSNLYTGRGRYFGDESIYEVICSRLFSKLGFSCAKYTLVDAYVRLNDRDYRTYVCKSENIFVGYDSRITLENLMELRDYSVFELIQDLGIYNRVSEMLIADFITIQRDRHGGNIELFEKNGKYVLSPLYDNGLSFLSPYPSASGVRVGEFDVLGDYPVNNYIGSQSLYQNLSLLKEPVKINRLTKEDRRSLFYGLGSVLPKEYLDLIWKTITYRYMFLRKRGFIIDG